jgi:hypothetical protein
VCRLALFDDSVDDTLNRRLEELRNIGSREVSTGIANTRHDEDTPMQLQLAEPNSISRVVVSGRSKLDVLWFFDVQEADLGCFVEASNDVVQVLNER